MMYNNPMVYNPYGSGMSEENPRMPQYQNQMLGEYYDLGGFPGQFSAEEKNAGFEADMWKQRLSKLQNPMLLAGLGMLTQGPSTQPQSMMSGAMQYMPLLKMMRDKP